MSAPDCQSCLLIGKVHRMIAAATTERRRLVIWLCPHCDGDAPLNVLKRRKHG